MENGGFQCFDWKRAAVAGAVGAVTGGAASGLGKVAKHASKD